jgi:anti-sigma factor ChrR (cupin superfamily)
MGRLDPLQLLKVTLPMNARPDRTPRTHVTQEDGSAIVRAGEIPWTRLAAPGLPGLEFKLMRLDDDRGTATMLMKIDAAQQLDLHKHLAAVEVYVVSGSFHYEQGEVYPGEYMFEAGGVKHAPGSREGAVIFVIAHGAVQTLDAAGNVVATVDNDALYALAAANGAASHLRRTRHA